MLGLSNHVLVLNPPCVRSKSLRNDRLKGHFEKRKAKSSKGASSSHKKFFFFLINICHIFIFNKHFYLQLLLCLIFFIVQFYRKSKKKKKKFPKKIQMCHLVAYNPAIYQPPNPYSHLGFTSDNAHGQSCMSWTNHSQVLSIL